MLWEAPGILNLNSQAWKVQEKILEFQLTRYRFILRYLKQIRYKLVLACVFYIVKRTVMQSCKA